MGYAAVKKIARSLGCYRQAVWFHRHLMDRGDLDQEKTDLAFFLNFVRKGDLVFDVGANYGSKSRVFLKLGARVVAFEPVEDCVEEWEAAYGGDPSLTIVRSAVAPTSGERKFYVRPSRVFSGFLEHWAEDVESEIVVPTVTLDQMIAKHGKPEYIKIDVEGYEDEVLKGLTQPVRYVSFEYHLTEDEVTKTLNCVQYLSGLGEIAVNIMPAEVGTFAYPGWLSKKAFFDIFPRDILAKDDYQYRYGDVFVATSTSPIEAVAGGRRSGVANAPSVDLLSAGRH